MGKMDPHFTSDQLKEAIVDYKKRKADGQVETYDASELKKELGGESLGNNLGLTDREKGLQKVKKRSYF